MRRLILLLTLSLAANAADNDTLVLTNAVVRREFAFDGHVWRTTRFARADGSAAIDVESDEFQILLFNNELVTLDHYQAAHEPNHIVHGENDSYRIRYVPREGVKLPAGAPSSVTITYSVDRFGTLRKEMFFEMKENQAIDRLEIERFSIKLLAKRGGRGEPVFVGDSWFFGAEYPGFYSRHTDGNMPTAYSGTYDRIGNFSFIDLEGRDIDKNARPGLIRIMHFPGYAKKQEDGRWGIAAKTAVAGTSAKKQKIEVTFMDYLQTIKRPARSYLHFNNWFDGTSKDLSIANFVGKSYLTYKKNLEPYGVTLDAMVPDDGWQDLNSIYKPRADYFPKGIEDVGALALALEKEGTHLGLWLALNGYSSNIDWGKANGFPEAKRNSYFSAFGRYYAITQPNYRRAIAERLTDLITLGHVRYFKHDFNEMCDVGDGNGHPPTDRHGHEASVDAVLELLALERQLQPDIYQNMTNGIWFSPWWLQHCNCVWMLADDDNDFLGNPEISRMAMASIYRDVHLHKIWGNPATRPLVPISSLMTHGLIHHPGPNDTLRDFADYVMAYYGRGVQLKEWYLTPTALTPDQWRVLARATRWSTENTETLSKTIYFGGDPAKGEAFGYISASGGRVYIALRNPGPEEVEVSVPAHTYSIPPRIVRGRVIYPYQATLPGYNALNQRCPLRVPGFSLMLVELNAKITVGGTPDPVLAPPEFTATPQPEVLTLRATIPNEAMQRCDLLLICRTGQPEVTLGGQKAAATRSNTGDGWKMFAYDLKAWAGKQAELEIRAVKDAGGIFSADGNFEAWLLLDRPVPSPPADNDPALPDPVAHGFRRQTVKLAANTLVRAPFKPVSAADLKSLRAAKLRIDTLGIDAQVGGPCKIMLNGTAAGVIPPNKTGDQWESLELDLSAPALQLLKLDNELVLQRDNGDDAFKFRKVTLAVQLQDGSWSQTNSAPDVQCSSAKWALFEGQAFDDPARSRPITLKLPQ